MENKIAGGYVSVRRRWLIFATIFFLAVCVAINMMKAPPIFTTLMPELGFTESTIGLTVSCYVITSVILAFPLGFLIRKFGAKKLLIATGIVTCLGSVLGSFATDAVFFLVSRFIEGISYGLITVVAIAAISTVMPNNVHGLALGIYSVWYPVGTVIAMLVSPTVTMLFDWRLVWWLAAGLAIVATVVLFFIYTEPPHRQTGQTRQTRQTIDENDDADGVKPDYRGIVLISLAFFAYSFLWGGAFNGFFSTFLQISNSLSAQTAGVMVAIPSMAVIILSPIAGLISDKLGKRKWMSVLGMLSFVPMLVIGFNSDLTLSWIFVFATILPATLVPPGVFAMIPVLAKKRKFLGFATPIQAFFQDSGSFLGAAVFGPVAVVLGWQSASWFLLVPVAVFGLVCALLVKE